MEIKDVLEKVLNNIEVEEVLSFELSEKETKSYQKFYKKHSKKCKDKMDTIGTSHIETTFTPTSLGNFVSVKCKICGKIKDITDMDNF